MMGAMKRRKQSVQIGRERRRLIELMQPLADVAAANGFATQSRLTSTFRRRTGFTPGEYRRGRS
jgi:AraC family transcriptional regulator